MRSIEPYYRFLKHNSEVKQLLFNKQPKVTKVSESCIVLGNPEGVNSLTFVLSPVCDPCMNELRVLLPILKRKENTRIEILFLTDKKEDAPFAFSLAIMLIEKYQSNSNTFMGELWDYVNRYPSSKYRITGNQDARISNEAEEMLIEQIQWCISNKIYSTPSVFIDGRQLPNIYTVKDIDYMLT